MGYANIDVIIEIIPILKINNVFLILNKFHLLTISKVVIPKIGTNKINGIKTVSAA